jgi:type I restriction enzyme M protein
MPDDIEKVAKTYHAWRGEKGAGKDADVAGFCKGAKLEEIRSHGHILTHGRYVGSEPQAEDTEPFAARMERLTTELEQQFAESARLEKEMRKNLEGLDYGT